MYVPSSTLAPYYRRTTAPATRRHRGAMRGPLLARHRRRPTPAVVPWRVSAEAALAPQSRRRRRFVVVAGVASLAAVAAVVVAVGLETVVNVVVQLGSAGHTAAAACAAPSIPLLLRAPRRPSILLQPQCRIQEDSCHSTAAARPLRHRRRAIAAACKLATRPTVEKNMPSYHLPICLRAVRCGAVRRGCRY